MVGIFSSRRRFDDEGLIFDRHAIRSDDRSEGCVQDAIVPEGRVCTNITAAGSGLSGDRPPGERWIRYEPEDPYPYGPGMHERPGPLPKPTIPYTSKHLNNLTQL
jgi:hypothetical protein